MLEITTTRVAAAARRVWKGLSWVLLLYVFYLPVTLFYFLPPAPRTRPGWLFLFLAAPPLHFLAEWVFGALTSEASTSFGAFVKAITLIVLAFALIVLGVVLA